jgi:sugar phosphate isomerase/epimerase
MIKSAVTIALVPQIKTGPWIFWENLEDSMRKAAELGFDAIELFTASGNAISTDVLKKLLGKYKLQLAAVGTGVGKVVHGLTLTDTNGTIREKAIAFIKEMMEFGALFGAPAIIGSMQGNVTRGNTHTNSIGLLAEALQVLDQHATSLGVKLIYEPLNRYETNLMNRLDDAAAFIEQNKFKNIVLLADLFHMNIEEADPAESIQKNRQHIGHVHFADSNRKPVGYGHTQMESIANALTESGYDGYVSAEAFPWPDPDLAAAQTIRSFNQFFK